MITQQCNRCKKKDTYPSGGKPSLFLLTADPFCIACNKGWRIIELNMETAFAETLSERRDHYYRLEE